MIQLISSKTVIAGEMGNYEAVAVKMGINGMLDDRKWQTGHLLQVKMKEKSITLCPIVKYECIDKATNEFRNVQIETI